MLVKIAVASAGAIAGYYVAENFILRPSDDSPHGFITKKDGFGLDDIVEGLVIGSAVVLALKVAGKG